MSHTILAPPVISPWFWNTLRPVGKAFFHSRYKVRPVGFEEYYKLKPPFLIMGNHVCFYDPAYVGAYSRHLIRNVAADGLFRTEFGRRFFLGLGCIPKAKGVSEWDLIRTMMKIKESGGAIGLFPEGHQSWDGSPQPIDIGAAKLMKLLKIPVVLPVIKGGYSSIPRWAFRRRGAGVTLDFSRIISAEEVKSMSVEELYDEMVNTLAWDDHTWRHSDKHLVLNKKGRAERLELLLFLCPDCQETGTLHSDNNSFACKNCGMTVHVNPLGDFESVRQGQGFRNEQEWNRWQLVQYRNIMEGRGSSDFLFADTEAEVTIGYRSQKMKAFDKGTLSLFKNRVEIDGRKGKKVFPLEELSAVHVHQKDLLEFYHGKDLYKIVFTSRRVSAYKWMQCIKMAREQASAD